MSDRESVIHVGDVFNVLPTLPERSVHCVITSPPYFGLRDYGVEDQLGVEKTPDEYVANLVRVFREVRRVLRDDGTVWLNLGDSYANDGKWGGSTGGRHAAPLHGDTSIGRQRRSTGLKPKDLIGIPWRVAFALQADGWYLRSDIIWAKPNPTPESVRDRPTKAHEYVFLFTKSERYFYDHISSAEPSVHAGRVVRATGNAAKNAVAPDAVNDRRTVVGFTVHDTVVGATRNRRTVWTITTKPYKGAHFATFPPTLVEPMVLAGTSGGGCCATCGAPRIPVVERTTTGWDGSKYEERAVSANGGVISGGSAKSTLGSSGGTQVGQSIIRDWKSGCGCRCNGSTQSVPCTVLDPFAGSGTVGEVCNSLGRRFLGIEIKPEYAALAQTRTGIPIAAVEGAAA